MGDRHTETHTETAMRQHGVHTCLLFEESDEEEDAVVVAPVLGDRPTPLHAPLRDVFGDDVPGEMTVAVDVSRALHRIRRFQTTRGGTLDTASLASFRHPDGWPSCMSPALKMLWSEGTGVSTCSVMGNEWQSDDLMHAVAGAVSSDPATTGVVLSPVTVQTILNALLRADHRQQHGTPVGETDTAEFYVDRVKALIRRLVFQGRSREDVSFSPPTSISAILNVPYGDGVDAIPVNGSIRMSQTVRMPPTSTCIDLRSSDDDGAGAGAGAGADPATKRRRVVGSAPPTEETIMRIGPDRGIRTLNISQPYGLTPELGVTRSRRFVNNHWGVVSLMTFAHTRDDGFVEDRVVGSDPAAALARDRRGLYTSGTSPWVYYDSSVASDQTRKGHMWSNPAVIGATRVMAAVACFAAGPTYVMDCRGSWVTGKVDRDAPAAIPYRGGPPRFVARPPLQYDNTTVCGLAAATTAVDVALAADAGHILYASTFPRTPGGSRVVIGRAAVRLPVTLGRPPNILSSEDMSPVRRALAFILAYGVLPSRANTLRIPPEVSVFAKTYLDALTALLNRLRDDAGSAAPAVESVFITIE